MRDADRHGKTSRCDTQTDTEKRHDAIEDVDVDVDVEGDLDIDLESSSTAKPDDDLQRLLNAKAAYLSKCSGDTTRISLAIDAIIDRTTSRVTSPAKYIAASVQRYFEIETTRNANRPEHERLGLSKFGIHTLADRNANTIRNCETLGLGLPKGTYQRIKSQLLARGTTFENDADVIALCKEIRRRMLAGKNREG